MGVFLNGPPEAVRMILLISWLRCPSMDWNTALRSLSTGYSLTPYRLTNSMKICPAVTRVSLLARAMSLPARTAAAVGARPAAGGRGAQPRAPDDGGDHHVCFFGCCGSCQSLCTTQDLNRKPAAHLFQLRDVRRRSNGSNSRSELADLSGKQFQIFSGGQGSNPETIRVGGDNLQGADTDGAGRAEDGKLFHDA